MGAPLIRTMQDLMKLYYSGPGAQFLNMYGPGGYGISKADAPVLTTTTGVYQAIFGAYVWSQLNQEANAFGLLPKVPWVRSGWRTITARGASTPAGGVAESGAIPDTTKPTFDTLSTKPKTVAHAFDNSHWQELLARMGVDDNVGDLAFLRSYFAVEHREHLNKMLHTDVDTLASSNMESIDRVVSSQSEEANCGITAGDSDIYSKDRSSATTWDAYVNHNNNSDRELTETLLRTINRNVLANGANASGLHWQSEYSTYAKIQGLYHPSVRYEVLGEQKVKIGLNGVQTQEGFGFEVNVAAILNHPFFQTKDVVTDTIGRLYLLDTSNPEGFDRPRLGISVLMPTAYFETGMNRGDPFAINKFHNEGVYVTMGELICTFFAAQGKIRDLQ